MAAVPSFRLSFRNSKLTGRGALSICVRRLCDLWSVLSLDSYVRNFMEPYEVFPRDPVPVTVPLERRKVHLAAPDRQRMPPLPNILLLYRRSDSRSPSSSSALLRWRCRYLSYRCVIRCRRAVGLATPRRNSGCSSRSAASTASRR